MTPPWTLGLEIELLAPRGSSRLTLAQALADLHQGQVRCFFHPQSEPSQIPNAPVLENLTLGFEVIDKEGKSVAQCVDDLTLQADCLKPAPPVPGWYRIVSDDIRLLRLVTRVAQASDPLDQVLAPVAELFGVELIQGPGGMVKVSCEDGLTIAIAAPLPGERERPCELISPPLLRSQIPLVEKWLSLAQDLHFTAPLEGATHLHIDASSFCSVDIFRNLINLLWTHGANLRRLLRSNPNCRKVGMVPESLWQIVQSESWPDLDWEQACQQLKPLNLSKYMDFNFRNMIFQIPHKYTIEVRILPVWLDFEPLIMAIDLIQALFERSLEPVLPLPPAGPEEIGSLLDILPLPNEIRSYWIKPGICRPDPKNSRDCWDEGLPHT